ncbi:MAG: hypothetical protein H6573_15350 [Lewinellaceae bacterium]|nr:hypothetical protein [Lewinellaceae bacterium]
MSILPSSSVISISPRAERWLDEAEGRRFEGLLAGLLRFIYLTFGKSTRRSSGSVSANSFLTASARAAPQVGDTVRAGFSFKVHTDDLENLPFR